MWRVTAVKTRKAGNDGRRNGKNQYRAEKKDQRQQYSLCKKLKPQKDMWTSAFHNSIPREQLPRAEQKEYGYDQKIPGTHQRPFSRKG